MTSGVTNMIFFRKCATALLGRWRVVPLQSEAKLCRLEMGDFMCELGERDIGERDSDCTVLGYAVQRRTISDLVWRGGKGEHLEQLGRLVSSPFKRSFLLLEGDPQEASSFSAFGVERHALMQNTPGQVTGVQVRAGDSSQAYYNVLVCTQMARRQP